MELHQGERIGVVGVEVAEAAFEFLELLGGQIGGVPADNLTDKWWSRREAYLVFDEGLLLVQGMPGEIEVILEILIRIDGIFVLFDVGVLAFLV